MPDLKLVSSNDDPIITTSLNLAAFLGRRHTRVLRTIRLLEDRKGDFIPIRIKVGNRRWRPAIGLTISGLFCFGMNVRGHGPKVEELRCMTIKMYMMIVPQDERLGVLDGLFGLRPIPSGDGPSAA